MNDSREVLPVGLKQLALLLIFLAAVNLYGAWNWLLRGGQSGLAESTVTYHRVSFSLSAVLMAAVAVGILKRSRVWGYFLGNVWAILAIAHLFVTVGMPATAPLWKRFPKAIIPLVALYLLNVAHRRVFQRFERIAERHAETPTA